MIRVLLGFLVVLGMAVGLAWLADNPGHVTVDWRDLKIETSLAVAAALALALAVAAALCYRGWLWLRRSPAAFGARREQRRRRLGYEALTRGLVAVAAGDAAEANRHAERAERLLDEPPLTLLLSAQAAQLDGNEGAAERSFSAMLERPDTEFLGLRGLLSQAIRRGDRDRALALAERARKLRPRTPWLLRELFNLQTATERWAEAEATLTEAVKRRALPPATARHHRAVISLQRARAAEAGGQPAEALRFARQAHALAPELVPAAVLAAELLRSQGRQRKAARLLKASWAKAPHPAIAEAFAALAPEAEPARQRQRLEELAAGDPNHPESRLLLARAAVQAGDFAAARRELEPLTAGRPGPRAARLMAEIEERQYADAVASREWLLRAAAAPPDPRWTCAACGHQSDTWKAHCAGCGAFDSVVWRAQDEPAELPALEAPLPPPALIRPVSPAPAAGGP